ncbi:MAG TPA: aspartyl protease family protein [Polyangia bacterium]|nr:aspartyl protease family protein [Polyangia bacterium]
MKLRLGGCGLLALVALSCGGSGGNVMTTPPDSGISATGMLGQPSTALISGNLIFVNASLDMMPEVTRTFGVLIDSGSPVLLIDPTLFGANPPMQIATTIDLGLLDAQGQPVVTIENAPAFQISTQMMDALGFGGILGGNVMRNFSVQLDYSAPMMEGFCLGCTASTTRTDVQSPGGVVDFTLAGGGNRAVGLSATLDSPVTDLPPSRIPVTVTIDGTDHLCIVDTGATVVSLRSTVYASLVADGRAQLTSGITIMTVAGASNAAVTRAKSITVGGQTVLDPSVMTIMSNDTDSLLMSISVEVNKQIDCLLGGSYLRNFLVTIDYPVGELHLQPYDTAPIPDEFRRVGFTIGLDVTGKHFVVQAVYPNTDAAAQGVMVNDEIVAVDGVTLSGFVASADATLDGALGTSKMITFGAMTGDASLANQTVSIKVDDLIPNP